MIFMMFAGEFDGLKCGHIDGAILGVFNDFNPCIQQLFIL